MFKSLDFSTALAFVLMVSSAILCVVYGALNWNKGKDPSKKEVQKETKWDKEEKRIDDEIGGTS